jgi:hypothetical protein
MEKIANSKIPQVYKDNFEAIFQLSIETNSEDSCFILRWDDDTTDPEAYVPAMVLRVAKKRVLDKERGKREAKAKKNPRKTASFEIKRGRNV